MKTFKKLALILTLSIGLTACGTTAPVASYESKTIANNDCKCSVEIPTTWSEEFDFHPEAVIQAGSLDSEELFMVLSIEKGNFKDVTAEQYGEYVIEGVQESADDSKVHRREAIEINGLKGMQFEVYAVIDKQETLNIFTFLDTPERFYQVVAWSTSGGFPLVEDRLLEVVRSFRVMP